MEKWALDIEWTQDRTAHLRPEKIWEWRFWSCRGTAAWKPCWRSPGRGWRKQRGSRGYDLLDGQLRGPLVVDSLLMADWS
jgi:hypothetical protein